MGPGPGASNSTSGGSGSRPRGRAADQRERHGGSGGERPARPEAVSPFASASTSASASTATALDVSNRSSGSPGGRGVRQPERQRSDGAQAGRGGGRSTSAPPASSSSSSSPSSSSSSSSRGGGGAFYRGGGSSSSSSSSSSSRGNGSTSSSRGGRGVGSSARGGGNRCAAAIQAIRDCGDLRELEALVEAEATGWTRDRYKTAINTALNRAGQLGSLRGADPAQSHRILSLLAAAYLPLVAKLKAAADCTIPLHACAKAKFWGAGLATALLQRLSREDGALLGDAKDNELSNLWWSLSEALRSAEGQHVLYGTDLPLLLAATSAALVTNADVSARHSSNILLACARLQLCDERLTRHLTGCLTAQVGQANCQDLANALYALGELAEDVGHKPRPEDLQGLVRAVVSQLGAAGEAFTPQALANMLLGAAQLGHTGPGLLRPLAAAAGRAAAAMDAQGLSNSLYSLALLQPSVSAHGGAVEALCGECVRRRFAGFNPQNTGNSIWALGTMRYGDQAWYAAAVEAAEQPAGMAGCTPWDWAHLWYALALVRHRPTSGGLLQRTADDAVMLRQGALPQDCANLLWAFANLRLYDERLVDALAGRLGEVLRRDPAQAKAQDLCNSLWALAVMGPDVLARHSAVVAPLLGEAERRWNAEGAAAIKELEASQVWYTQLELAHVGGGELQRILGAGDGRPGSLLCLAREAAEKHAVEEVKSSDLERQVVSALERLAAERLGPGPGPGPGGAIASVERGPVVPGLGRAADVVVELAGGRRVAVEVDGPSHFLANRPRDPTAVDGPTELRNRQLARVFGYGNVLCVPYWQWVGQGPAAQEALLCRLLGLEGAAAGA